MFQRTICALLQSTYVTCLAFSPHSHKPKAKQNANVAKYLNLDTGLAWICSVGSGRVEKPLSSGQAAGGPRTSLQSGIIGELSV